MNIPTPPSSPVPDDHPANHEAEIELKQGDQNVIPVVQPIDQHDAIAEQIEMGDENSGDDRHAPIAEQAEEDTEESGSDQSIKQNPSAEQQEVQVQPPELPVTAEIALATQEADEVGIEIRPHPQEVAGHPMPLSSRENLGRRAKTAKHCKCCHPKK